MGKDKEQMENLINDLYYGNICPVEQMDRPTPGKGKF